MGRDVLSVRQMMVLLAVALLAPSTDLLPTLAAKTAGAAGWLIPVGALPVLLLALWAASRVFCGGGGCKALGKCTGYTIIILYLMWGLISLAVSLRASAVRLQSVSDGWPVLLPVGALLVVAVWMGMGGVAALGRAAEIFYLVLAVAVAAILVLAVGKMEPANLSPSLSELSGVPGGSVAAAGMLLGVAPAAIVGSHVPQKVRSTKRAVGWIVAFCTVISLVLVTVIGCLGPGLSGRIETPYFIMVQGLGVKGAFQRTEALAAALWLLSDLTRAGLLLQGWRQLAGELVSDQWGRRSVPVVAVAAGIGGWILLPEQKDVVMFCCRVQPILGVVLGLMIPCLLALVRKKSERRS